MWGWVWEGSCLRRREAYICTFILKGKKDIKQEIYKSSRIIFFGIFEKEMTNCKYSFQATQPPGFWFFFLSMENQKQTIFKQRYISKPANGWYMFSIIFLNTVEDDAFNRLKSASHRLNEGGESNLKTVYRRNKHFNRYEKHFRSI